MKNIIEAIKQNNIKVKNPRLTKKYVNAYGYNRIIVCYGEFIKSIKKHVSTIDIINTFKIDNIISNHLVDYILDFEMKLNNSIITKFLSEYNLPNDYVLDFNDSVIGNLKSRITGTFMNDIYENVKSCNLLNNFQNAKSIPLNFLCLSWSFHTLLTFFQILDERIKISISRDYGFGDEYDNLISVCHSIRKFRNTISHNGMFIATKLSYYRREFNTSLQKLTHKNINSDDEIDVFKLISMLSFLLNKNIEKELIKILKKSSVKSKILKLIKNYIGLD